MERLIWQYWEGTRPDYITMCLETVRKNSGAPVRLLGRADFDDLLVDYNDIDFSSLTPVQRSDVVRAIVLREYGGMYIDADCIVLKPLVKVFERAEHVGCCVVHQDDGEIQTNFICTRPHGSIITGLADGIIYNIRSGKQLKWLALATDPLVEAMARCPHEMALLPTDLVAPVHWSEPERFVQMASDTEHAAAVNEGALCYMLSNDTMKSHEEVRFVIYLSREALLKERYFISYLFRRALAG